MKPQKSPLIDLFCKEDDDLVELSLQESSTFAELYHRHFNQIYRYLLAVSGSTEEAQDLTSQTFIAAHEGLSSFHKETSFAAWLTEIARKKAAEYNQTKNHLTQLKTEEEKNVPSTKPERLLEFQPHLAEFIESFIQALNQLSPEDADIITLRLFAGLSTAETAWITHQDEAFVKMSVFRGLRDLRKRTVLSRKVEE